VRDQRKVSPDNVEDNIWLDNRVAAGQCDFRSKPVEMVVGKDYQVVSVVHCKELPSRRILDPTKSTPSLFPALSHSATDFFIFHISAIQYQSKKKCSQRITANILIIIVA
jgi:hypothetical protein